MEDKPVVDSKGTKIVENQRVYVPMPDPRLPGVRGFVMKVTPTEVRVQEYNFNIRSVKPESVVVQTDRMGSLDAARHFLRFGTEQEKFQARMKFLELKRKHAKVKKKQEEKKASVVQTERIALS